MSAAHTAEDFESALDLCVMQGFRLRDQIQGLLEYQSKLVGKRLHRERRRLVMALREYGVTQARWREVEGKSPRAVAEFLSALTPEALRVVESLRKESF